jgi:hypothetical protein
VCQYFAINTNFCHLGNLLDLFSKKEKDSIAEYLRFADRQNQTYFWIVPVNKTRPAIRRAIGPIAERFSELSHFSFVDFRSVSAV